VKVLLASDFFPPTAGGLEAHVQRLAAALLRRGHEVGVVTTTAEPDPLPEGAPVISAETTLGRMPQLFKEDARPFPPPWPDSIFRGIVRRFAHWWQPDIIHAHGWCAFSCYWPGSPPLVVTLHDHGLRCPKKTLFRDGSECLTGLGPQCATCRGDQSIIKRLPLATALTHSVPRLISQTSKFIAVSQSVAQRAAERGASAEVVPNFIDVRPVTPSETVHPHMFLFVGPDSPFKGRSVAVDAFRRLPPGRARLSLVGNGAPVEMPDVTNSGYLHGSALWQQYQAASIMLVPSSWPEPCPTVVLEAMLYGLPVLGSRIGGIPDLVEHGSSGLLVPPNDPASLADSMETLLADDQLHRKLSIGAQKRALQFDASSVVPQIEAVYQAAVVVRKAA
jgi:glycosyltransferase involved in cell wall biosynthesis